MFCTKCGAANNDEDIFCTECGAVLIGVSLDDPEAEAVVPIEPKPAYPAQPVPIQPVQFVQPVYPAQPVPIQPVQFVQPVYPAQPAYAPQVAPQQPARMPQQRQRKRKSPYPQGIEWLPFGGAVAAFLCLLLTWFSVGNGLGKSSLFGAFFDFLKDLGNLGFLAFICIALYLVLIVAPVMIAYFTWRRDNNYMGLSLVAILAAILAELFTWLTFKSLISKATGGEVTGIGFSMQVGFYLYILAIGAAIAGGVLISMQRQKKPRRTRPTQTR